MCIVYIVTTMTMLIQSHSLREQQVFFVGSFIAFPSPLGIYLTQHLPWIYCDWSIIWLYVLLLYRQLLFYKHASHEYCITRLDVVFSFSCYSCIRRCAIYDIKLYVQYGAHKSETRWYLNNVDLHRMEAIISYHLCTFFFCAQSRSYEPLWETRNKSNHFTMRMKYIQFTIWNSHSSKREDLERL